MSYANARCPVDGVKSSSLVGRSLGGDGAYMEDHRKIQEAVRHIQQHASEIRKEARLLATAHGHATQRQKVQDAVRAARSSEEEARRLLQGLSIGTVSTPVEQNMRRLTQQKLSENLVGAARAVEESWKAYEAAHVEAAARPASAAVSVTGADRKPVTSRRGVDGVEMRDLGSSDDEERSSGQRQAQLQDLDVSEAEVETHAAIVEEMVNDVTSLNSEIRGLQRAMVDLASTTVAQGETLDCIESHMGVAADSTQGATEQLVIASRSQSRSQKCLLVLVALCFVLSAIIICIVVSRHG